MYRFKRIIQNNLSKPEELSGNVRVFLLLLENLLYLSVSAACHI